MRPSSLHYFPLTGPFLIALFFIIGFIIVLVEIGVLSYAYEKMGVGRQYVFGLLVFSLLGSYVNIPVAELPAKDVLSNQEISFFGMRYVIPLAEQRPRTMVAINLGGAVIPFFLTLYLLVKHGQYARGLIAVTVVTAIIHWLARPVRGMGIAVPIFIPPLAAATIAFALAPKSAPSLAYISGTLGTLIGADLLNLGRIQGLGAPIVSIGGAGTFDGIFMTGILAVLLA
ncbi:MAG TPA: DUF1614 domain-containing protein [Nitrospiria bacterium]|nr:DUF1614 domain-containing protein [Nitrospiria bacterium]